MTQNEINYSLMGFTPTAAGEATRKMLKDKGIKSPTMKYPIVVDKKTTIFPRTRQRYERLMNGEVMPAAETPLRGNINHTPIANICGKCKHIERKMNDKSRFICSISFDDKRRPVVILKKDAACEMFCKEKN